MTFMKRKNLKIINICYGNIGIRLHKRVSTQEFTVCPILFTSIRHICHNKLFSWDYGNILFFY